ncbi:MULTISPECIES: nucleoside triphosphate pyrophosphatase [unclassified Mycobacterium]|uniref:Maf family protein n=1 Tax=unclassified Mycobacterium TaxID=2642494 RepID=UPI0029C753CD|nr:MULTISPECIES: nucleoside triphosphate pyrophosphatase [unclassified Mycobacterium]
MTRVVLASASPGRRRVLRQAGIDPLVIVSGVDEDAIVAELPDGSSPDDVTTALATAKARAVVATLPSDVAVDCVVIGCDSMLLRDGRLRGKPESEAAAIAGWRAMAGTSAELHTGHCVIRLRDNAIESELAAASCTTVHFGNPPPVELAAYARSGEPTTVAGGFTLDGLGGWFVDGVTGDPSAVIGIGLPLTRSLLERAGLSIADLWVTNPLP